MALTTESRADLAFAICGIEATYNENPSITGAANAFLTADVHTWEADVTMFATRVHSSSFTRRKTVPTVRLTRQECTFYLQGGTGAGVADKQGPLLRCCGIKETIVASTSVTYAPATIAQIASAKLVTEL